MRFSDTLCCIIFTLLVTGTAIAQSRCGFEDSLHRIYGAGVTATAFPLKLETDAITQLNERNGSSHPWKAVEAWRVMKGGESLGWAFVDNVKGKSRPITYLTCFDREGKIIDLEILKYRESHGGEVASEMFRSQFRGKSDSDKLQVGRAIRNISGATISSRSITRGARALATLARYLITTDAR